MKDSLRTLRVLVPLIAAALAVAAPNASATPLLCPLSDFNGGISLIDSAHNVWDLDALGEAQDGGHDAFDGFGLLYVNNAPNSYTTVNGGSPCDLQLNGQQLAYPELDSPVAGLKWSRKVYAPATGTAFARWVDFLRNTTAAPIVLPTIRYGGDLGSDGSTVVIADSDGSNSVADPNTDQWTVSSDGFAALDHDPAVAEIWDGTAAGAADASDHLYNASTGTTVWATGDTNPVATYDNVTVPANGTIAYMHVAAVDLSDTALIERAPGLAAGSGGEVFRGLSVDELGQIQNWNTADADGDGIATASDNCMTDPNADQADLDKDGIGDVCDDDKDGDGISNANEAVRGTDPAKADTDGDGKLDAADVCPAKAGAGDDGCPRFDTIAAVPAVDKTPPVTTVSVSKKAKRAAFLKGVKVKVACNEGCSIVAELSGSAKAVQISKAYNLLLARKSLASGGGSRTLTLKPSKKLIGKAKKFSAQLKVTTKDVAGNVTVKTVTIKVG